MKRLSNTLVTMTGLLLAGAMLTGCERPPMQSKQQGPDGAGMVQITNPREAAKTAAAQPAIPAVPPSVPGGDEGPKARDVYQNVKVLGHLSVGEFTRHMVALTAWVSPEQGCTYCHVGNLADDSKYQKVVARRMIQMNQDINGNWTNHVGATGVTCYTCHRGNPVPPEIWFKAKAPKANLMGAGFGDDAGQNRADPSIALASLPYDPFSPYLLGAEPIRVQGDKALPHGNRASIKQAEHTYSLMNHMSESLGQNCTFCHNTQSFGSWDGPATRGTAWYGIRMARNLNVTYMEPLTATFPAHRLGETGDVAKVNCATCHQGVNKPLGGLAMAKDFTGFQKVSAAALAAAAAAPVAATAPAAAVAPAAAAPAVAPAEQAVRSTVYFPVGKADYERSERAAIAQAVQALKSNATSVATLSGYHSASGTLAQNQALAKDRAFNVRDALIAEGVAVDRIKLERPQQTEANAAGEDASARRVEITVR
jgi:photosynthetic reaction center cytochrome c subunit